MFCTYVCVCLCVLLVTNASPAGTRVLLPGPLLVCYEASDTQCVLPVADGVSTAGCLFNDSREPTAVAVYFPPRSRSRSLHPPTKGTRSASIIPNCSSHKRRVLCAAKCLPMGFYVRQKWWQCGRHLTVPNECINRCFCCACMVLSLWAAQKRAGARLPHCAQQPFLIAQKCMGKYLLMTTVHTCTRANVLGGLLPT